MPDNHQHDEGELPRLRVRPIGPVDDVVVGEVELAEYVEAREQRAYTRGFQDAIDRAVECAPEKYASYANQIEAWQDAIDTYQANIKAIKAKEYS